jgi:hypothetical protein
MIYREYVIRIIDSATGNTIGTCAGTAYYLSTQLQALLERIPEAAEVLITKGDEFLMVKAIDSA